MGHRIFISGTPRERSSEKIDMALYVIFARDLARDFLVGGGSINISPPPLSNSPQNLFIHED